MGDPEIVTTDSSLKNTLLGRKMHVVARNDTIHELIVEGQATSTYFLEDESGEPPGLNKVTGDIIIVYFSENKVDRVAVDSNPGQCTGTYEPTAKKTNDSGKRQQ
jgi:hypothetical protein